MKKKKREKKAFTLIELLAVIIILSIISLIVGVVIGNVINNARKEDSIIRSNPTVIENTYKHMITSIYANGSNYRYKNVLSWKIIPTLRSYDIIGIGFLTSVEPAAAPGFKQEYCLTYGGCHMSTLNTPQYFNTGAGASFKLISGDLSSLKETFYFDVKKKNPNSTVTFQMAYGDYAHATSETGLISSTNYEVVQSLGIVLDSSISSSYDSLQEADAAWYGTW